MIMLCKIPKFKNLDTTSGIIIGTLLNKFPWIATCVYAAQQYQT